MPVQSLSKDALGRCRPELAEGSALTLETS
jgi:hypothetical protein